MSFLVNGRSYDFGSLKLGFLGNTNVAGFRGISYGEGRTKSNVLGAQSRPVERTHGAIEPTASLTLTVKEVRNIIAANGNRPLHTIPAFPITASYANGSDPVVTDVIQQAEFTEMNIELNQGDDGSEVTLPLVVGGITWNA